MELLAHGCRNKEIAATLRISLPTVATHMVNIFEKLQVGNRAHAVAVYVHSIRRSGIPASRLAKSRSSSLSSRQREVLEMLRNGQRSKDINAALGVSVLTVNTHVRRICQRLQVRSRAEAVAVYTQSLFSSQAKGRIRSST
jgi:DNA-binding NarL/FixJ family response regulator